jgi:hypothetical protein
MAKEAFSRYLSPAVENVFPKTFELGVINLQLIWTTYVISTLLSGVAPQLNQIIELHWVDLSCTSTQ